MIWDADDLQMDVWVAAAVETARGLCVRAARSDRAETATLATVDKEINAIEQHVRKIEERLL